MQKFVQQRVGGTRERLGREKREKRIWKRARVSVKDFQRGRNREICTYVCMNNGLPPTAALNIFSTGVESTIQRDSEREREETKRETQYRNISQTKPKKEKTILQSYYYL